jgi:hypothetical protein
MSHIQYDPRGEFRTYEFARDRANTDPGAELVALTNEYLYEHPTLSWYQVLGIVKASTHGQMLMRAYQEAHPFVRTTQLTDKTYSAHSSDARGVDVEIDNYARKLIAAGETDYCAAVRRVLAKFPDLRTQYAALRSYG